MATTNGASPVAVAAELVPLVNGKRKRSESEDSPKTNGNHTATVTSDNRFFALLQDIRVILQNHDTKPSILQRKLQNTSIESPEAEQPPAKRSRTADTEDTTNIDQKLSKGAYNTLEQLVDDVDSVALSLVDDKSKDPPTNGAQAQNIPPTIEETRLLTGILAFKKVLNNLVSRETARLPSKNQDSPGKVEGTEDGKFAALNSPSLERAEAPSTRKMLTLFANAQGPKTLFSSLQLPAHIERRDSAYDATKLDQTVDVNLPISENTGLPGMLRIAEAIPAQMLSKPAGTFAECFAPPASVPQLNPPKPPKSLTTKGSAVTWVPPESLTKSNRKGKTYFTQPSATGQWLSYSGIDAALDTDTPEAKQKSRQRALSTGEARPPLEEATRVALEQAREDALFRSVYSSFAPCRDDAVAVVPTELKNRIWWHKVGSKRFDPVESLDLDPLLSEGAEDEEMADAPVTDPALEDELFQELVETFEPDDIEAVFGTKSREDKAVDDLLQEITELIETLHSHQRIRSSTLVGALKTPVTQTASVSLQNGTPSSPSTPESDVYKLLKTQLSVIISMLPPYAVAKLNGDQLAALNISRKLVVETDNYQGVLDEDQVSRIPKVAPMGGAPPVRAPVAPSPYNQYSRGPSTPHAPPARPSYYPQHQATPSTPAMQYNNSRPRAPMYPQQGVYPGTNTRPSYSSGPVQTPRPNYTQPNPHSYYQNQRPPVHNYNPTPGGYYSAQTPQSTRSHHQPVHAYNQRPPNVAPMFNNNNGYPIATSPTLHNRTASPLKPNNLPQSHQYPSQPSPRPGQYSTQPQPPIRPPSATGSQSQPQMHLMQQQQLQQTQHQPSPTAANASAPSHLTDSNRHSSGTPQPTQSTGQTQASSLVQNQNSGIAQANTSVQSQLNGAHSHV